MERMTPKLTEADKRNDKNGVAPQEGKKEQNGQGA